MNKKLLLLFLLTLALCRFSYTDQRGSSNISVSPVELNPLTLPPPGILNNGNETHQRGPVPDPDLAERIKNTVLPAENDPNIIDISTLNFDAPIYNLGQWDGPNQNGWVPADVDIAQGNGYAIVATNEQFHIYSTTGFTQQFTQTLQNWFNNVGAVPSIFDPKVIYDDWSDRWVLLALGSTSTESYYYVSVSQSSNPTGSWWNYKLNAHVDGSTSTNFWADYPGLGFSYPTGGSGHAGAVVITSNQYNRSSPALFQYGKIRVLRTSQLYVGAAVSWYDFWNWSDQNGDKAFTWQPARQVWSTTNCAHYLLNTKWYGSNVVTLWRLDNTATTTPTLTRQSTVSTTSYTIPPSAPSQGGSGTVDAFDCRTQNVWFLNGHVYNAWVSAWNWGSGNNAIVHYVRISVGTNAVVNESRFGSNGIWFMHPSAAPEYKSPFTNGYAGISFSISSSSMYPSHAVIGHDGTTISSYISRSGTGYLGGGLQRFGDYSGIAIDDAQNGVFWGCSMLARSSSWGTGATKFAFSPVGIKQINGEVPVAFKLNQNYPNPFNPSTKINFSIPKSSNVNITVFDMLGRKVETIVNEFVKAGNYELDFDGSSLSSGTYFYRITAEGFSETKKMILNK